MERRGILPEVVLCEERNRETDCPQRRGPGIRKVQSSFGDTNFAVNPSKSYFITASVHHVPLTLMIDTGAAVSLLGKEQWMRLGGAKFTMEQWNGGTLVGVNGSPVDVEGVVSMDILVGGQRLAVEFVVVSTLSVQSLLGH